MLIVVPVSNTDDNLIEDFVKIFNLFGPYDRHELLVVCRPSDESYGRKVYDRIAIPQNNFRKEEFHAFWGDGPAGWPVGPNFYWKWTADLLIKRDNKLPWLWMELDMTPLRTGWADALDIGYRQCKKPFMGNFGDTTVVTGEKKLVKLCKHLVGAAVYPPCINEYSKIWTHVPEINTAWDVLCQWEFVPLSHETKLIQFCFRTQNYRKELDVNFPARQIVIGEDTNGFPGEWDFDNPIDFENAVIMHGCNDGSLARLLYTEYTLQIT